MRIICEHGKYGWILTLDPGDGIEWRPIELVETENVGKIVDNLAMAYALGFNYPHIKPEEPDDTN